MATGAQPLRVNERLEAQHGLLQHGASRALNTIAELRIGMNRHGRWGFNSTKGMARAKVVTSVAPESWLSALNLHRTARQAFVRPNALSSVAVASCYVRGGRWAHALGVLRVAVAAAPWQRALAIFQRLEASLRGGLEGFFHDDLGLVRLGNGLESWLLGGFKWRPRVRRTWWRATRCSRFRAGAGRSRPRPRQ